jgi:hypothetical protein
MRREARQAYTEAQAQRYRCELIRTQHGRPSETATRTGCHQIAGQTMIQLGSGDRPFYQTDKQQLTIHLGQCAVTCQPWPRISITFWRLSIASCASRLCFTDRGDSILVDLGHKASGVASGLLVAGQWSRAYSCGLDHVPSLTFWSRNASRPSLRISSSPTGAGIANEASPRYPASPQESRTGLVSSRISGALRAQATFRSVELAQNDRLLGHAVGDRVEAVEAQLFLSDSYRRLSSLGGPCRRSYERGIT